VIHLTYTSIADGETLCGVPRTVTGEYWHAVYAPLGQDRHRAKVCPECLKIYALAAWDIDDVEAPAWVVQFRSQK